MQIIGVGNQLAELENDEKELYQDRLYIGRTADQKEKFAKEQPYYPDAPKDLVSASELIRQQQDILAQNGENQRKREQAGKIREETKRAYDEVKRLSEQGSPLTALRARAFPGLKMILPGTWMIFSLIWTASGRQGRER